jgi:hypothetical protein
MSRLFTRLAWIAIGFAASAVYREWQSKGMHPRHRHMLETWENEGGALPEPATAADSRSTSLDETGRR